MIAAYAMGGGLGHVRRTRAVLAALAPSERCAIFTASRLAIGEDLVRVPRRLAGSAAAFADWLRSEMRALAPSAVVVDAFPLGILGEFAHRRVLPDVPLHHVARLLRWDEYTRAFPGTPPRYTATYTVEPLTPRHEAYLRAHSGRFAGLELPLSDGATICADPFGPWRTPGGPLWLVVHSGTSAEVGGLLEAARARAHDEP